VTLRSWRIGWRLGETKGISDKIKGRNSSTPEKIERLMVDGFQTVLQEKQVDQLDVDEWKENFKPI
jgi:hypothetical protein